MKIALMLTGHIRKYRENFPTIRNTLLSQHDVDIYCCTWNKNQRTINQETTDIDLQYYKIYESNLKSSVVLNVDEYEKNKPHLVLDDRLASNSRATEHIKLGWHERLYDQWYLVNKCWESIQNPDSYDVIFRCRFDISLFSAILRQSDGLVIPKDIGGWNFSDHLAYGKPTIMQKYCSIVNHIQNL